MQHSADFLALGMHHADVQRAEHELARRLLAEQHRADGSGPVTEPVARHHRGYRRVPRLALR